MASLKMQRLNSFAMLQPSPLASDTILNAPRGLKQKSGINITSEAAKFKQADDKMLWLISLVFIEHCMM